MKFWQVDSFTDTVFTGNPAAVFISEGPLDRGLRQNIAMEMNLAETAFVETGKGDVYGLSWFTPCEEVDLCGHATLAAAHILWEQGMTQAASLTFNSRSGVLHVSRRGPLYELDFPAQPASEKPDYAEAARQILGCEPVYIGSNGGDCLMVLDDADFLRGYQPRLNEIAALTERGLILSAKDDAGQMDYLYRAFFPKLGIPEDPATGSANTCLTPYWAAVQGKTVLKAFQCSARGGVLEAELAGDRVLIRGSAVTVFEGRMLRNFNP